MAVKLLPSRERLKQLLRYEPDTGNLFWLPRPRDEFVAGPDNHWKIWNVRYADKEAMTHIDLNGYRIGALMGKHFKAHRIIWKIMTGVDPDQVDHINGVRHENWWDNLRDASALENAQNAKKRNDNTSGAVGVYWYPHERKIGKWLAKVGNRSVGYFDTFEEALDARAKAVAEAGYHVNHGRVAPNKG